MSLLPCPWPIAHLLPHAAPMLLLDRVLGYSDTEIAAFVEIRPDHPLIRPKGVPVHVGIELMAQTCGAHVGALALAQDQPVRLGFLLGTRRFQATADWFLIGDCLNITAGMTFRDDEMGVFDCRILRHGQVMAEAQLNVFQPRDAHAALNRGRGD